MKKPADPAEIRDWIERNGPLACPKCNRDAVEVELLDIDRQPHEILKCRACGHTAEFLHPPFGTSMDYPGQLSFTVEYHAFLGPWQRHRND